ncbi:TonB-dependent siderophore receptor [Pokkaliibacter plantistimulans]|uniref:TonB-dependent siderophore receptor n=1 Tax=Proteobacteria bacterium 228 TaxID=2083153 RepID=A0A2S5KKE5_9PROT|nr:FepA family TonB-dependent siderophore receptor [Pokkaliibacter plantistimulans]PPC75317.1 TonB-dependent siderophore receptor [Pokkaliibacter plantistimulans]
MSNRFKAVAPSASTVTSRGAALRIKPLYAAVLAAGIGAASLAHADDALQLNTLSIEGNVPEETVSPDASAGTQIITAEQLKSQPKTDLKEMLATLPGVTVQHSGNNSEINIRGMGSEYALILVDGKRVSSRETVRYERDGGRDTNGDLSWIPTEAIDHIEVISGPAAARYGSGAMGGVINIITKKSYAKPRTSVTVTTEFPENSKQGASKRMEFNSAGGINEALSYRVFGSLSKTDADAADIHDDGTLGSDGSRDRNIDALLSWKANEQNTLELEGIYGREETLYAGDSDYVANGDVRAVMRRKGLNLTHRGHYGELESRVTLAYDQTRNIRLTEGLAGGGEGVINSDDFGPTVKLTSVGLDGEAKFPLQAGVPHEITVGGEVKQQKLYDATNSTYAEDGYDPEFKLNTNAQFVEDAMHLTDDLVFTVGLRRDDSDQFGDNYSPSGYLVYHLDSRWSVKGGVARAYKAPNLYQINPNYLLLSRGNGCYGNGMCYLRGNSDLKPETSTNTELGFQFDDEKLRFGLTYFHNDFKNKISSGRTSDGSYNGYTVLQWTNIDNAIVQGVEGSFNYRINDVLNWTNSYTHIIEAKNEDTGATLSQTPKDSLTSSLDWQTTNNLNMILAVNFVGKQQLDELDIKNSSSADDLAIATYKLGGYATWDISANYKINDDWKARIGLNNVFDREVTASDDNDASYDIRSRTLFASLTASF